MQRMAERVSSQNSMLCSREVPSASSEAARRAVRNFWNMGECKCLEPPRGNGLIHIRIITVFFGAAVRSLVRCGTCQKVVVSLSIFRIRNDSRELYDANRCSKMVVCLFFRDALPESVASPQSFPDFVSDFPGLPGGALAAGGKRFRIPVRVRTVVGRSRADSARPIRRALPDRRRVRSISPRTDSLWLRSRVVPCGVCRASGLRRSSKCCPR